MKLGLAVIPIGIVYVLLSIIFTRAVYGTDVQRLFGARVYITCDSIPVVIHTTATPDTVSPCDTQYETERWRGNVSEMLKTHIEPSAFDCTRALDTWCGRTEARFMCDIEPVTHVEQIPCNRMRFQRFELAEAFKVEENHVVVSLAPGTEWETCKKYDMGWIYLFALEHMPALRLLYYGKFVDDETRRLNLMIQEHIRKTDSALTLLTEELNQPVVLDGKLRPAISIPEGMINELRTFAKTDDNT